jgi:hypothetical protein
METSACLVARGRSCGPHFPVSCREFLPLRAPPGSTIQLAGWTRYRDGPSVDVFWGDPEVVRAEPVLGGSERFSASW